MHIDVPLVDAVLAVLTEDATEMVSFSLMGPVKLWLRSCLTSRVESLDRKLSRLECRTSAPDPGRDWDWKSSASITTLEWEGLAVEQ
jgi:hypothetical protein